MGYFFHKKSFVHVKIIFFEFKFGEILPKKNTGLNDFCRSWTKENIVRMMLHFMGLNLEAIGREREVVNDMVIRKNVKEIFKVKFM